MIKTIITMNFAKCVAASLAAALIPAHSAACATTGDLDNDVTEDYVEADTAYAYEDDDDFDFDLFVATDTVKGISGKEASIGAGTHAVISVPSSMRLLSAYDTRRLLELYWNNTEDSLVLGALVPVTDTIMDDINVAYILYYDGSGHVDDDDAADIDYDSMLEDLQESTRENNAALREMGYPEQEIVGWAKEPSYDAERKVLRWAKHLRFIITDSLSSETLNYNVRVLGRHGFVEILAVADIADADAVIACGDSLSTRVSFADGYAYSDFNPVTDDVSDWTIGGLVAGGALLAKTGILAKIGLFLLKAWKVILLAIAAIGALVAKIVKGRKKGDEEEEKKE